MRLIKTSFVLFCSMGLVPVGLIEAGSYNPLNVALLLIYFSSFILIGPFSRQLKKDEGYNNSSKIFLVVIVSFALSYFHMVFTQEKFSSWIIFYSLNFILFWIMLNEIKSFQDIEILIKRMFYLIVCAIGLLAYFYFNPNVLDNALFNAGMGSFRGYEDSFPRIFTPGMIFIAFSAIFFICKTFLSNSVLKNKIFDGVFFLICFFSVAIVTSVRTYILGMILGFVVAVLYRINTKKIITILAFLIVATAILIFVNPQKEIAYISNRLLPVTEIKNFDVKAVLNNNFSTENNNNFGTYYWRISEAYTALSYLNTPSRVLLGATGQLYNYAIIDQVYAPHIGYIGIYFAFGLVGVTAFLIFIIYFSAKMFRLMRLYKNDPYEYFAVFIFVSWVVILIFALVNSIFYYIDNVILVSLCALSVILEKLYHKKKSNNRSLPENHDSRDRLI